MSVPTTSLERDLEAVRLVDALFALLQVMERSGVADLRTFIVATLALEDAALEGLGWIRSHRCAGPELEMRVGQLFASYANALESAGIAFERPRPPDAMLDAAISDLTESMTAVSESLGYLGSRLPISWAHDLIRGLWLLAPGRPRHRIEAPSGGGGGLVHAAVSPGGS